MIRVFFSLNTIYRWCVIVYNLIIPLYMEIALRIYFLLSFFRFISKPITYWCNESHLVHFVDFVSTFITTIIYITTTSLSCASNYSMKWYIAILNSDLRSCEGSYSHLNLFWLWFWDWVFLIKQTGCYFFYLVYL